MLQDRLGVLMEEHWVVSTDQITPELRELPRIFGSCEKDNDTVRSTSPRKTVCSAQEAQRSPLADRG